VPDEVERIEFGMLGPLEVRVAGRLANIGGVRQRALLAVLLLHANELVPTERLIEEVWGDDPPPTAQKMVQVFVSRLRTAFETDGERHRILVTRPAGYLLAASPDQLDLARFDALVVEARSMLGRDPRGARDRLRSALSLWRGAPLSDLALEPFAQLAIPRLEELRLAALEDRVEADLAIGGGGDLVGELRDLVAANPLRERFQSQLMLALYRAGRQAEALDVYTRARAALGQDLGIEPGPELQRLQGAILRQESWLDAPGVETANALPMPLGDAGIRKPARGWRQTRRLAFGGALILVVGASVGFVLANTPKPPAISAGIRPTANSVVVVDPTTESLVKDLPVGAAPGPIVAADGSVWVGNGDDHTLTRIDVQSGTTLKTFGLSSAPTSLCTTKGTVWIGNGFVGTLSRVRAAYDQLSSPFFPGPSISGLLAVAGTPDDLWAGLADQTLLRLDPASLRPRASLQLSVRVRAMAVIADAVWILEFRDNAVTRIDLAKGAPTASVKPAGATVAIASGEGLIWVATSDKNQVLRLDPESGSVLVSLPLSFSPTAMVADAGTVWVVGGPNGTLARIDPSGQTMVTSVDIGRPIGDIAVANGQVWLTID
jgi:DNA-binding SARP family transcriptional activator/streptogramin lyase